MLLRAGFLLLLGAVLQVSAEYVQPDFIENVMEKEAGEADGSRIVSGWEAQPGQHPHHAALRMVDAAGGVSSCGGSVVARDWVVTAAHCTAGRITLVIRAGVVSLTTPEYIFETTEWFNHPTYNDALPGLVQPNDISIVKLQRPVTYTRNLKAIRIQPSSEAFRNYASEQVYASGHGRTWTSGALPEVLNWVYLRAVSNADCARTFGSIITDNTICAQFFNVTSQSTCQGDSGGPSGPTCTSALVHVGPDGAPYLVGVTSFVAGGDFGCHSGLPAGFIRPGPFLSWFKEVSGIDFENLNEEEESEDEGTPEEEAPEGDTPEEEAPEGDTPEEEAPEGDTPEEETPDGDDEDSESEEDDDKVSEILKRLEVSVKVKVRFNKYKVKKEVEKEKEIAKAK